jgi:RNA recognition motif-containing protein
MSLDPSLSINIHTVPRLALLWTNGISLPARPEKEASKMDVILYIANLAISTTEEELRALFMQVGEVTAVSINKDRVSGASKGFGFLSMSFLSEADRAVSRFNAYSLSGHKLKVRLARPRSLRGETRVIY